MKKEIDQVKKDFQDAIKEIRNSEELEQLRVQFLGRKNGKLTMVLKSLKTLSDEAKREIGPKANELREHMQEALEEVRASITSDASESQAPQSDITLPGIPVHTGHLHPLTQTRNELVEIFRSMGYMVFEGPELDNDFYNFEALNFPPGHPARDIQDTFFIKSAIERKNDRKFEHDDWVMRTHTSNMQVRVMEQYEPPLRCVIPGRSFRNEATDASHEHTFHQLEAFVVDTDVSVGQLVWTMRETFKQFFHEDVKVRLRPGYFPFTEPSYEPDISCVFCNQKGCPICKKTGWIEIGGSGMIHPRVLEAAGYEPGKYTGFAFGMGYDRLTMLKHHIPDIRMFLQNDIRFLEQF